MSESGASVRDGKPADVPFVFDCIRALAEFEGLLGELRASAADLERHLFGSPRWCELLIAEHEGLPCGYALYFGTYSTFLAKPGIFLEDLFVVPEHRGRGAARALLVELARRTLARGGGRLEWSVLDWNERAIRFYRSLGAEPVEGWVPYRLAGDALAALASER